MNGEISGERRGRLPWQRLVRSAGGLARHRLQLSGDPRSAQLRRRLQIMARRALVRPSAGPLLQRPGPLPRRPLAWPPCATSAPATSTLPDVAPSREADRRRHHRTVPIVAADEHSELHLLDPIDHGRADRPPAKRRGRLHRAGDPRPDLLRRGHPPSTGNLYRIPLPDDHDTLPNGDPPSTTPLRLPPPSTHSPFNQLSPSLGSIGDTALTWINTRTWILLKLGLPRLLILL